MLFHARRILVEVFAEPGQAGRPLVKHGAKLDEHKKGEEEWDDEEDCRNTVRDVVGKFDPFIDAVVCSVDILVDSDQEKRTIQYQGHVQQAI